MDILEIVKKQFPNCKVKMDFGTIAIIHSSKTIYLLPDGSVMQSEVIINDKPKTMWLKDKNENQINFY